MNEIREYLEPGTVKEALQVLADRSATLLAGGTDLMPQSRDGAPFESTLMNVRRLPELHGIDAAGRSVRLGALTTVTEILESRVLAERAPILGQTADQFASDQIRNVATIGGNLGNASPAGDMIIPLLVLEAEVELVRWSDGAVKTRRLPLEAFFVGPGQTQRKPHELIAAAHFEAPEAGFSAGFRKCGTRPALDISVVSMGLGGYPTGVGFESPRVAFGAVAPTPLRGRKTEAAIAGRPIIPETVEAAVQAALGEVSPISDVRGSAWYRTRIVETYTRGLLNHVARA